MGVGGGRGREWWRRKKWISKWNVRRFICWRLFQQEDINQLISCEIPQKLNKNPRKIEISKKKKYFKFPRKFSRSFRVQRDEVKIVEPERLRFDDGRSRNDARFRSSLILVHSMDFSTSYTRFLRSVPYLIENIEAPKEARREIFASWG